MEQDILDVIRAQPCAACGKPPPSDPDHIRTRGSGGKNLEHNLWPLCRGCHSVKHYQGLNGLLERKPMAKKALRDKGWYFDEVFRKWLNVRIEF